MNAIQITITLIVLLFANSLMAQDIITLKSGEEIKSQIIKVAAEVIMYKKYSDLKGPTLFVNREDVGALAYENGTIKIISETGSEKLVNSNAGKVVRTKEDALAVKFTSIKTKFYQGAEVISKEDFLSKIQTMPGAQEKYKEGKSIRIIANVVSFPAAFLLTYNLTGRLSGASVNDGVLIGSGALLGVAIILDNIGKTRIRQSIKTYNGTNAMGLNLNVNENGVGIAISF